MARRWTTITAIFGAFGRTDITERFNSPYTLEPYGFYLNLKRRVDKKIQSLSPEVADAGRKRVIRVQN
jgi:hypothetical protein